MNKHIKYLSYVIRHKWYVFVECHKLGIPWLGITHDISKFTPDEWLPYVNFFYGSKQPDTPATGNFQAGNSGDSAFDRAWLLHQKRNRHHWQYWILREDDGGTKTLPIPDKYRREMIADWRGAGLAQGKPDTKTWYLAHKDNIVLHQETRDWIEGQLGIMKPYCKGH